MDGTVGDEKSCPLNPKLIWCWYQINTAWACVRWREPMWPDGLKMIPCLVGPGSLRHLGSIPYQHKECMMPSLPGGTVIKLLHNTCVKKVYKTSYYSITVLFKLWIFYSQYTLFLHIQYCKINHLRWMKLKWNFC